MNEQNNNGNKFFNDVPNNQNMNNGNNFDPFTGQPINNMSNASVEEPVSNPEPIIFNGFGEQPASNMNSNSINEPVSNPEPIIFNGFGEQPVNNMNDLPANEPISNPEPINFAGFAGQNANDMNSVSVSNSESGIFNGFVGQSTNDNMNSGLVNQPGQHSMSTNNFDPNTGRPIQSAPVFNFDPNTGQPLNGMNPQSTVSSGSAPKNNKKVFFVIGCIVVAIVLFFVFGVKVITCSNENELYGVEITTKVTSVAIFGDIKAANFTMEYDFSDVDDDEKEELIESLTKTYKDKDDYKIKEKGDKVIITMEGFKDEDKDDYPIDDFIEDAEDLGLTCK